MTKASTTQKRQPKGKQTGGQYAPDVNPESTVILIDDAAASPSITRSTGIAVGAYRPGGGYRGITKDLDETVVEIAEKVGKEFNVPIEIRFNSDRRRGGAWLTIDGNTSQIGISANQRYTQEEAKNSRYFKSFNDEEAQEYLESCDRQVHLDVYVAGELLRNPNEAEQWSSGSRRFMQSVDNIGSAITFVREHTIVGDNVEIERRRKVLEENSLKHSALKEKAEKDYELAGAILIKERVAADQTAVAAMIRPAYRAQFESDEQELYRDYWNQIAKESA